MRNFYKPGCQEEDMDSSLEITDEGELFEDLDGDPDSENAAASPVDSDTDSSDDDFDPSEMDSDDSNGNIPMASTSRQAVAESSANKHGENLEDDEEDETVRAIISAIKKPRTQPPEIKVDDFVTDLSFHPDNDILAIGLMTGDVLLYNYSNDGNNLIKTLEIHDKAIRDVEFSEDGLTLLTGSKDKSIMITDVETEKLKQMYEKAHESSIYKLYILDEHLFTTGDDSGTVKMWDIRSKDPIFSLKEVEDYISGMLTNDAKKLLLVTSGDGYLTTINIGARKMYVQSEPYDEELTCMGLYRNDSKLVVGTSKGKLYTFNWGQFGYHCDMFPGMRTPISAMLPITDRIGCVAGEEGILRAAHIAPFRNLGIVGQHSLPVETMDINHSGEFMASSSHNNDVQFWNIKYFEDFGDIKYNVRHNSHTERRHNLPSSKFSNAADFFADLAE